MAKQFLSSAPDEMARSATEVSTPFFIGTGKVASPNTQTRVTARIADTTAEAPTRLDGPVFIQPPAPRKEQKPIEMFVHEPGLPTPITPFMDDRTEPTGITPFRPIVTEPLTPPRSEPLPTSVGAGDGGIDPVSLMPLPVSLPVKLAQSLSPVSGTPTPQDAMPAGNLAREFSPALVIVIVLAMVLLLGER